MKKPLHQYMFGSLAVIGVGIVCFSVPGAAYAIGEYTSLVTIPGVGSGAPDLPTYINSIYLLTIAVGVLIAILRIAFAGVKYSMSGVITDKSSAKNDIRGVLLGLAILLTPALVLNTINPELLNLNVLEGVPKLDTSTGSITPGAVTQAGDPSKTTDENIAACKGTYNPATKTCYVYQPIVK